MRIHAPHLTEDPLTDRWVQRFLEYQLGWLFHTATKAASKHPKYSKFQGLLTFLRMARLVNQYQVKSPRMIVNADQTGVSLLPTGKKTWEKRGSKQVSTPNHDEKRQYTIVVASSCGGDFLPIQSVWGGSTPASLPKPSAPRRAEADAYGFTYAHGDTRHWSSLGSTKKWVKEHLVPFLVRVRTEEGLPSDSPAILYIDAWSVHTAKSDSNCFIPWMKQHYPEIKLIFVPAGCEYISETQGQ
ncbi:hypothetical protein BDV93DRAFT_447000 [Ceratobasidium sp. AG-I]|nr:hypothetical protein BDV93DRAFT_447000 [Ceratobasidium sp. AG-I]